MAVGLDAITVIHNAFRRDMAETDAALAARYQQAQQDGQLAHAADIDALAMLTSSVMHGIAVRARAGGTRAQLEKLARAAEDYLLGSATD